MARKHRVLIADDDVNVQETLRGMFEAMSFEVETASDVEETEQRLRDRIYCLLLLDMVMPMNKRKAQPWKRAGMEILRRLRGRIDWRRLPAIIITAFSDEHLIVEAFKAGANDFCAKPFETEEQEPLQKKIHDALEFGCASRRSCPHLADDEPGGKRVYAARYMLQLVGDTKKRRALAIFEQDEAWFQCRTFEGLGHLTKLDGTASDPEGWINPSLIFPGVKNVSHALSRMLEDIEEVTGVTDLVERKDGRVRLGIPPECVTWDMKAMLREFRPLVNKYCA